MFNNHSFPLSSRCRSWFLKYLFCISGQMVVLCCAFIVWWLAHTWPHDKYSSCGNKEHLDTSLNVLKLWTRPLWGNHWELHLCPFLSCFLSVVCIRHSSTHKFSIGPCSARNMKACLELGFSWNSSWTDLNHPRKQSGLCLHSCEVNDSWLLAPVSTASVSRDVHCCFPSKNQTLICHISFGIGELHLFSWPTLWRRKREALTESYWGKVWISSSEASSLHWLPFISTFGLLYCKWKFMKRSHVCKHWLTKLYWHGKVGMLQDQCQLSYSLVPLASWIVIHCSLLCHTSIQWLTDKDPLKPINLADLQLLPALKWRLSSDSVWDLEESFPNLLEQFFSSFPQCILHVPLLMFLFIL